MTRDLREQLDAFVSGECPPATFVRELSALCEAAPESSWDVLALLDQYHRRGKVSGDFLRSVRHKIERIVLGVGDPGIIRDLSDTPVASPVSATATVPDADEVHELRAALVRERDKSRRYRNRIAKLVEYGRQQRTVQVAAQRTSGISHCNAMVRLEAPRTEEKRPGGDLDLGRNAPEHHRQWPRARSSAAVLVAAALLSAGASPDLEISPTGVGAASMPGPAAIAPVLPVSPIPVPGQITLSSDRYVVFPGKKGATIQVDRAGGARGVVNFLWWTEGSGARPGKDYVFGKPRMARLGAGEESVQLSVQILANPLRKHTEMFYVVIGQPDGGAALGSIRRAAVFIMRPDEV